MKRQLLCPCAMFIILAFGANIAIGDTTVIGGTGPTSLPLQPYVTQGPFVGPAAGPDIPVPSQVPGKLCLGGDFSSGLYSHWSSDIPWEAIRWDGIGGSDNQTMPEGTAHFGVDVLDAIASANDALFDAVIDSQAALVFSAGYSGHVVYETADGQSGVWAAPEQIQRPLSTDSTAVLRNVDGLDLWGAEDRKQADLYSLYGDHKFPSDITNAGQSDRVAVWRNTGAGPVPWLQIGELADAIGLQFPETNWGMDVHGDPADARDWLSGILDVDAMMVSGSSILFSVVAFDVGPFALDGGEIFVWDGVGPTRFLEHGGHVWDTAFDIAGTFGLPGDDIHALEAVAIPEPTSAVILLTAAMGILIHRRRGPVMRIANSADTM